MKDYEVWRLRELSGKRYAYVWADGIYAKARLDDAKLCLLVLIGATQDGKKELIAVEDGYRESEASWLEMLRGLEGRGLAIEPELAVGDGALGFWKALAQVWSNTKHQRCWMHKTGNILNYLPKAVQPKAKQAGPTRNLDGRPGNSHLQHAVSLTLHAVNVFDVQVHADHFPGLFDAQNLLVKLSILHSESLSARAS